MSNADTTMPGIWFSTNSDGSDVSRGSIWSVHTSGVGRLCWVQGVVVAYLLQ